MEGKYLINTDDFFTAPDGKEYKAVWGEVKILQDSFLGVKTNARSANWYAMIGTEENHVIVAGCQIHYAVKCIQKPFTVHGETWNVEGKNAFTHKTPSKIYIP